MPRSSSYDWIFGSSGRRGCKYPFARLYGQLIERNDKAAVAKTKSIKSLAELRLAEIFCHDNLIEKFFELKTSAGQSPGPDGLRFGDLSGSEVAAIMRQLSQSVLDGTYRPYPGRHTGWRKPDGRRRTIMIREICDRTIAKALNEALAPAWQPHLDEGSHGFRPERGVWSFMAHLAEITRRENRWVLVIDDIQDAFPSIPIELIMQAHRQHLRDEKLLNLINTILKGGEDTKQIGIEQGSAPSPACFEAGLKSALDRPYTDDPNNPPLLRYGDNLTIAAEDGYEGRQAQQRVQALLSQASLNLKGKDGPPKDLPQGDTCQSLGFELSKHEDQLRLGISEDAWESLMEALQEAHTAINPPQQANQVITGWLAAMGPTFEHGNQFQQKTLNRIKKIASQYGYQEILSTKELRKGWKRAYKTWKWICRRQKDKAKERREKEGSCESERWTEE